jgi:hypothetical protein
MYPTGPETKTVLAGARGLYVVRNRWQTTASEQRADLVCYSIF